MNSGILEPIPSFPALILKKNSEKILIVSDLHIGWEASLAKQGIHISSQTPKIIEKILELIETHNPSSLFLLGDIKHTIAGIELSEWREVPDFFRKMLENISDINIILGNHDGNLKSLVPRNVKIFGAKGTILDGIGVFHGHAWPSIKLLRCNYLIMGHLHPVITLRDNFGFRTTRRVWMKTCCDIEKITSSLIKRKKNYKNMNEIIERENRTLELLIMPSFNEILSGQPVNMNSNYYEDLFFGPILRSDGVKIEESEVFLLDRTFLGKIKDLK